MDKREFLKASGALIAGAILSKMDLAEEQTVARTNWSGNYTYSTDKLDLPKNAADVQAIMRRGSKLKALGARHSFNGIADSMANRFR